MTRDELVEAVIEKIKETLDYEIKKNSGWLIGEVIQDERDILNLKSIFARLEDCAILMDVYVREGKEFFNSTSILSDDYIISESTLKMLLKDEFIIPTLERTIAKMKMSPREFENGVYTVIERVILSEKNGS